MSEKKSKVVSRREFIKKAGLISLTAIGSTMLIKPNDIFGKEKGEVRYGMLIDLNKCFGCHACSVACKTEYDTPLGVWQSWVIVKEKGKFPKTKRTFVPVLCNNCESPPCVKVCPSRATKKEANGIVSQNDKLCIGCKYCIQACPYKVRYSHPKKKIAQKCDFCVHRLKQGISPSCVNTCNSEARVFGNINDPNAEITKLFMKNRSNIKVLKPEFGTNPHVFYIGLEKEAYSLKK